MTSIPAIRLDDGHEFPQIGFGTYPLTGADGVAAIRSAIDVGYRLLDTAVNYENEVEVGEALRASGLPREDVQIATKVPGRDHGYDETIRSLTGSLERLGVDHVDLYLIHWPNPSHDRYVDTWRAMIELRSRGLARSIGVSNFTPEYLARLSDETGVTPAVNQVELHPYFPQTELLAFHQEHDIATEAWSPLGKAAKPHENEVVTSIAEKYGVTPGQVVLRWHVERGVIAIPKSATPSRQRENLDVFGFELSEDDVDAITALGRPDGRLFGGDPTTHEEM
jgi:diketogulonate reductase-like aldo/keto reductase